MLMSRVITLMLMFSITLFTTSANNWEREVEANIHNGHFASADSIMRSLPSDLKLDNSVKIDSFSTIMQRIKHDFRLSRSNGIKQIKAKLPRVTNQQIENWIDKKYIETIQIDGTQFWFRKAVRNLWLLNKDLATEAKIRSEKETNLRLGYASLAKACTPDENGTRNWHTATIKFTFDVDANAVPAGNMLKVWIPFPLQTIRQRNIKLLSSSSTPTMSAGSPHNTVYMEQKAVANKKTHFEVVYSYEVGAQSFDPDTIIKNLRPYNNTSSEYRKFTATQPPHIIIDDEMKMLAHKIVGTETNPVMQASMIFEWISETFPWAGARDYSTIPNIPKYVLSERHGDCGQVTLLYITLARALGIPARWESGWMLHPGEKNLHDWAETYFEGTGWVPTDISFGRTQNKELRKYYKTGTDIYRMATNRSVNSPFSPTKQYIRTETVDSQTGEAEWINGNINASKWDYNLEIINFEATNK